MSDFHVGGPSGMGGPSEAGKQQRIEQKKLTKYVVNQKIAQEDTKAWAEADAFNPLAMQKKFKTLEKRQKKMGGSEEESESEKAEAGSEKKVSKVKSASSIAQQYQKRNKELGQEKLMQLLSSINPEDTPEEILQKVQDMFPDPSLTDEALEFLLSCMEDTPEQQELASKILNAKDNFNSQLGREIKAGRNILYEAQGYAEKGLGTATGLRDLYRDITGNPREPNQLFHELSSKYAFQQLKELIAFLLHSLGADMNAKGPSIDPAELMRLFSETRVLQAILGVYYFFRGRIDLLIRFFKENGLSWSALLSFESMAKAFMKFLQERYPSADKALSLAQELGIEEELLAKMIVFSQFRDAVRGVSPRLYRSTQHRLDVYASLIDAIEEIDEQLEEEEEEAEDNA